MVNGLIFGRGLLGGLQFKQSTRGVTTVHLNWPTPFLQKIRKYTGITATQQALFLSTSYGFLSFKPLCNILGTS